jgi:hypothetical protein
MRAETFPALDYAFHGGAYRPVLTDTRSYSLKSENNVTGRLIPQLLNAT